MLSAPAIEYPDQFVDRLEVLWGRGFLSPGGGAEVREILEGVNLAGKTVLDIGCGTGGAELVMVAELSPSRVVAIDVEEGVLARARGNAEAAGVAEGIEFKLVAPGPLAFPDATFDVVFSKDSMIHIPDKAALFAEVLRVLRPGGAFAASDWLGGDNTATSPEWARFRELAHLSFTMATAVETEAFMRDAGMAQVSSRDRNVWYAEVSRQEVRDLEGPLREAVLAVVDEVTYTHWLQVRRALADSVAAGAMRPTHLRGRKP